MRAKSLLYVLVVAWVGETAAVAGEAVPLVPEISPAQPAELVGRFHKALADGLRAGGLAPMDVDTVCQRLKLPPGGGGCGGGACVDAAAATLGYDNRYAAASIQAQGKNYEITVRMYAGRTPAGEASGRCDICTLAEALRTTSKVASDASAKALAAPPPVVAPTPSPPKPEPAPVVEPKQQPTAEPKVTQPLQPVAPPPPPPARRRWPLWPALAALGVGVAGLAGGIPLLAIDGDPTNCIGDPRPDGRNCADLYSTAGGGWALTGVGITALAASGVFFYLHFSQGTTESSTQVSVLPLEGGMLLGASGAF